MIPSKYSTRWAPTHRELSKKIREALSLVKNGRWSPGQPVKLKADFDELEKEFDIEMALLEDQEKILLAVLNEIKPEHYAGTHPPTKAYETTVKGRDLFAFAWKSPFFDGQEMYFKFCMNGTDDRKRVFILSIHPSRN